MKVLFPPPLLVGAMVHLSVFAWSLDLRSREGFPANISTVAMRNKLLGPVNLLREVDPSVSLANALVSILNSAFKDSRSLVVLYDDSVIGRMVLSKLLISRIPMPVQAGEMTQLHNESDLMPQFLLTHRNTELDLTVILFLNAEVAETFLEAAASADTLSGPLLLVNLGDDSNARHLLLQIGTVRRATMLFPKFLSRGRVRYLTTTYLPYSPSKFYSEYVDLTKPVTRDLLFKERYPSFQGHKFQVASWIDDFPYLFYNNDKEVVGIGKAMLEEISSLMNFTYELQEIPPDGHWGELINGTWFGMMGQVVRKEKDFIINGFPVVLDRYQAADFTVPYFTDSYSITLQVPPPFPRWLSVVYPFSGWVWVAVALTLLILAVIFHLLIRTNHTPVYNHKYDIISTLVWLSRNLLRQSVPRIPMSLGCRVFLGFWWMAALVLSTSYMGNLIAFLTVPAHTRRIATLEELANSKVKINMLDYGNFVPGFLWSSKEPVLHLLGEKLTLLPDYDQVIAAFDEGAGVLEASEYSHFLFITRKRSKNSYAVEEKLFPNYVAWPFQKGSPYKHVFDRYLERMSHSGLVEYWRRSIVDDFRRSTVQESGNAVQEEKTILQPLTLENLQGAFIVMGLGTFLAMFVLVFEILTLNCC